jgi:hypothetical protein
VRPAICSRVGTIAAASFRAAIRTVTAGQDPPGATSSGSRYGLTRRVKSMKPITSAGM